MVCLERSQLLEFINNHQILSLLARGRNVRDLRNISIGSFSNDDGDGNENVRKAITFITKITTLHVLYTFWFISLPSMHDQDVKFSDLGRFMEDVN